MRLNVHYWSGSTIIDFTFYLVPVGYKFILGQVALQHILYLFLESPIYPVVYFIVIEPSQDDSSYCNHVMISNGFIVTCFFQKQSPGGVLQKRDFKNIRKTHMTHTISIIIKNVRKIFWIMLKMRSRAYLINLISLKNFHFESNHWKMFYKNNRFTKI